MSTIDRRCWLCLRRGERNIPEVPFRRMSALYPVSGAHKMHVVQGSVSRCILLVSRARHVIITRQHAAVFLFLFRASYPLCGAITCVNVVVIAQFYLNNFARPECSAATTNGQQYYPTCLPVYASKPRLSVQQQQLRSAL